MDYRLLEALAEGTDANIESSLNKFNTNNVKTFEFPDLSIDDRKAVVKGIFRHLNKEDSCSRTCRLSCLETLRCLSRDKQGLEETFTKEIIDYLVRTAGLFSCHEVLEQGTLPIKDNDFTAILEAQKVLCNLIYNSPAVQRICSSNSCIEGIFLRLKTYSESQWSHDIKFFDMRMLFLITALCADIRPKLRQEFHGLIYLMEILDLIIKWNMEAAINKQKDSSNLSGKRRFNRSSKRGWEQNGHSAVPCLSDEEADLAVEVLKVLYNLTVSFDRGRIEEEDLPHFQRLVCILHDILLCSAKSEEKKVLLQSKTVELLTNMPPPSFEELLTPEDEVQTRNRMDHKEFDFYGMNVETLFVLLNFLAKKLEQADLKQNKSSLSLTENLSPILACLREMACANHIIRKFFKSKVLPPLKDVKNRPEDGDTLRNKLVRLMTSPMTMVKQLVAEFLFVLCKENVTRLVKYTGYGNAAGLLANRGLMLGNTGPNPQYSSDSEDSDTEEYAQYRNKINPVTGCYEEPGPNPMEGMSEEQKEYEAVQLVNMIDKLSRDGLMKPMRVGADGRPHPVEHVLEIQANLERK